MTETVRLDGRVYSLFSSDTNTFLALTVVEALEPCKETLEILILNFAPYDADPCFRSLSPVKSFTSLRTIIIDQDTFRIRGQPGRDNLFKLLPSSIEILGIEDFVEDFNHAILEFASHLAEGEYPNLRCVSLVPGGPNDWLSPDHMSGKSFHRFARGQDAPRLEAHSDHPGIEGIDINPYQRLPGEGREGDADDREVSEDGGLEVDAGAALDPDDERRQQEWVWFGRRCLTDSDLMSDLVRRIHEDSIICIRSSLRDISLRKKIRLLLLETNVQLDCAEVYTYASDDNDGLCCLWDIPPIDRGRKY